ncbi:hypothetical protein NDN17_08880 [Shewanella algae]|uniref:hypothetical protein n=1 Tax=Shewanella algae TaxID=38313 RepID=UPI001C5A0665|nr:hypothetical protein [Shewanella algae]MCM2528633.1 hypothetical protein [Shewanella algae]HDS1200614.1 hypothetical protein [Shewanella algae]
MMLTELESKYIKFSLVMIFLFLSLQMVIFTYAGDFSFESFVKLTYQLTFLLMYLILVYISFYLKAFDLFLIIFAFQFLSTFYIFGYFVGIVGNPLGIDPVDAVFYDEYSRYLSSLTFGNAFSDILTNHDLGELGFTLYSMIIYSIPGDSIFNMKVANVAISFIVSILVYFICRLINLSSRFAIFFTCAFAFNPLIVYYNATGLKEPLFQLFVISSVFLFYASFKYKSVLLFVFGVAFCVSTSFFRLPYSLFIITGFLLYFWLIYEGKYRRLINLVITLLTASSVFAFYILIGPIISGWFSLDLTKLAAHRLGKADVGFFDYLILFVVGIVGPLPYFDYKSMHSNLAMYTVPNFLKVCTSLFFIFSIIHIFRLRLKVYYPLLFIFFINLIMLVIAASTFDFRYVYPILPLLYIVMSSLVVQQQKLIIFRIDTCKLATVLYFPFIVLLIFFYNFR